MTLFSCFVFLVVSILCPLFLKTTEASGASTYYLGLHKIYTSHGSLKPAFQPQIDKYTVSLLRAYSGIDITPEIDYKRPEYEMGSLAPIVTLSWQSETSLEQHTTHRHVELPENGKPLSVYIKVANPKNSLDFRVYTLTIIQSKTEIIVGLKNLEIVDDKKNLPTLYQQISLDRYIYDVFVKPGRKYVKFKPHCAGGNTISVNGIKISGNSWTSIPRENDHYRQIVEIMCSAKQTQRKYFFSVIANRQPSDIQNPAVIVTTNGFTCTDHVTYYDCPNPKSKNYKTQLMLEGLPDIRYTIESSDKSVQLRAFSAIETLPFEYSTVGKIKLVAEAGRGFKTWDINFVGTRLQGIYKIIGILLGVVLISLLASLIFVLGFSNFHGIGTPIGIPEAATTLILIVQFVCFATNIKGIQYKSLSDIADNLKWITLFWPPPGSIHFSSIQSWGDPNDIRNAYGCLFWTFLLHAITFSVHGIFLLGVKGSEATYTIPHNMRLGNWEQRLLHNTCFPMCVAASLILFSPYTTLSWKICAGFVLLMFPLWCLFVGKKIYNQIKNKEVAWVWNTPPDTPTNNFYDSGYWCDHLCDQLVTQPVNRSLFKNIYSFQWTSTVADISPEPVFFLAGYNSADFSFKDLLYSSLQQPLTRNEESSLFGSTPINVQIFRTVRPKQICRGQRLITGLMKSTWLDILMTYEGLTQCYSTIVRNPHFGDSIISILVKTFQLTGPHTGGLFCFFYDGSRMPFIRLIDIMYRLILGALLGVVLIHTENAKMHFVIWSSIAIISACFFLYHLLNQAYTRAAENLALGTLIFGILLLSFVSIISKYFDNVAATNYIIFILLGFTCCAISLLTFYGIAVLILTYSALLCPPLEESRFLEEMANCNVVIAQDTDHAGWTVDVPGYSQIPLRDLKVQCTVLEDAKLQVSIFPSGEEPSLQISVFELLRLHKTKSLRKPVLSLFLPDSNAWLGYRHLNVYETQTLFGEVCRFLEEDPILRCMAESVARNISLQLSTSSQFRSAMIISMTIIFPGLKPRKKEDEVLNYD